MFNNTQSTGRPFGPVIPWITPGLCARRLLRFYHMARERGGEVFCREVALLVVVCLNFTVR